MYKQMGGILREGYQGDMKILGGMQPKPLKYEGDFGYQAPEEGTYNCPMEVGFREILPLLKGMIACQYSLANPGHISQA